MSALSDALEQIWDGQLGCYDEHVVTIGGQDYPCDAGEFVQSNTPEFGGLVDEPTVTVAIKRSLLIEFTADTILISADSDTRTADEILRALAGIRVQYQGKEMKIGRRRTSPDNTVVILDIMPRK